MKTLKEIIAYKKEELNFSRKDIPVSELIQAPLYKKTTKSFKDSIRSGNGIIAEFKRKSPSAGIISSEKITDVLGNYEKQNVSAFSILTDEKYFGGHLYDLQTAADNFNQPVLRKDFIIDEYQVFEAKANGADAILLIAAVLDAYHAKYLCQMAQSIGLEVLMEFHCPEEFDVLSDEVDVIGINNRNLKTMKTDVSASYEMLKYIPYNKVKISESGITDIETINQLYNFGFDGCLMGEALLKNEAFVNDLGKVKKPKKLRA